MGRSLAKDHDQKRQFILKTAAGFFAHRGYDRASMNELAQACGVSKSLIYHYHVSKEALLYDILFDHLDQVISAITSIDAAGDAETVLRRRVDALLTSYRGADDEHKLQLGSMDALPEDQHATLTAMQRQIVKSFADDIARLNPKYFSDKQVLTPVTMSLFGMLNWFYMWYQQGGGITRHDYAEMATEILLGGVERLSRNAEN